MALPTRLGGLLKGRAISIETPLSAESANDLVLALVATSESPLLLLDGKLTLLAASDTFCRSFDLDPALVPGLDLDRLGGGEWQTPQLDSLLRATAAGLARVGSFEVDLEHPTLGARRLVLNARKLAYRDAENVRLILTVTDVTDVRLAARLKDDLLREKTILLEELQHRVANSLQIIASVLMQSAQRASDEARTHLFDAHHRVMSVAAVQKQLAASRLGLVNLRPYLTELCRSIGAALIRAPSKLSLEIETDDSAAAAGVSVSLGLVVTELVINAVKHAFPEHEQGSIRVSYDSDGADWTLTVTDDGIGMPLEADRIPGLGTSIVAAIAAQLKAKVIYDDSNPGTTVSVVARAVSRADVPASEPSARVNA